MRVLIKGGVWKNTEDEILKAAVMKYGKNQWARVASLLNRKSAKQCKARWYEWLDPSIKKTEWSREEEEKLLHLAKLMPNQWRTIAPIVGRTAGQCMEHYERLLDQAQEAVPEGEDPRRLRPGEIDPTPEAKPARPDPIDMDEDEKEMLAEARARLANTQGKKAKRKARERQLDDSRRLATLQKRRELKAAGVESKLGGSTKRKYIDYTKEIPFQKVPPAGFYTVDDENRESKRLAQDKASRVQELAKLEGRHEREEEEREREKDKRRLKSLFKVNAAQVIAKVSEQNDPTSLRRRLPLSLPAPQVSDSELEDIVKVSQSALMLPPASLAPGSRVGMSSQSLIGDYSSSFRSAPTPLRTPQQENMILQEAHNLRILRDMAPMSGDDVAELKEGTGFGGINPRNARLATPNTVLGTPMRGGESVTATPMTMISGVGAGTQSVSGVGSRRGISSTPQVMRDALGLNQQEYESDNFSVSDVGSVFSSRVPDRLREREVKRVLTQQLSQLPEPEYTYEIALPSVEDGEDGDAQVSGSLQIEDAADAEERQARAVRTQLALLESRKSSVLKRELPRPVPADFVSKGASADAESEALNMVLEETARLIRHDAAMYPFEGVSCSSVDAEELHSIPDQFLANARAEIAKELDTQSNALDLEAFNVAWEEAHRSVVYLPQREVFGVPGSKSEMLEALATQFAAVRARSEKEAKRAGKLESKIDLLSRGYSARAQKLQIGIQTQFARLQELSGDLLSFNQLSQMEIRGVQKRVSQARAEAMRAEETERCQQQRYSTLKALLSGVA